MIEKKKEFAAILAFDVKVMQGTKKFANNLGIKVFTDDVIYRLSAHFKAYINKIKEKKKEFADEAIYPCVLNILPNYVFNKKDLIAVHALK